jgi:hypothetical protein
MDLNIFLTSVLVGEEWLASHPGHFTPGKELPYPLDRRLGRSQTAKKILMQWHMCHYTV